MNYKSYSSGTYQNKKYFDDSESWQDAMKWIYSLYYMSTQKML